VPLLSLLSLFVSLFSRLSLLVSAKHRRIIVLETDFLALPNTFHIRLPCSKGAKEPVQSNVLGPIVAIKVGVVNVVVIVASAWEDKATMSKPSSKAAVDHEGNEDNRVDLGETVKWENGKWK